MRHTYKLYNIMSEFTELHVNGVSAETEKAYKFNVCVSWNANCYSREFWFPKSVVKSTDRERVFEVKTWFINKLERENAFHGYEMRFDLGF